MNTITTTTTTDVRYHGWTLPKGSTVTVEMISLSRLAMMNHSHATVTAQCELSDFNIGLPTYAINIAEIIK